MTTAHAPHTDMLLPAGPLFEVAGLTDGWSFRAARLDARWDALGRDLTADELPPSGTRVAKRTREIIAGHILARDLMAEAGLDPRPLLRGPDRAPVWPRGFTGSITHTDGIIAAAFGPRHLGTIGIDIEAPAQLNPAMDARIRCHGEEGDVISLFVAKEAVFKAQFPRTGAMLAHHDVRIARTGDAFTADINGKRSMAQGCLRETAEWITGVCIVPTK
ncbi:MAG: hypothetical protein AAGF78_11880 [Pseudomonadota bacterium]